MTTVLALVAIEHLIVLWLWVRSRGLGHEVRMVIELMDLQPLSWSLYSYEATHVSGITVREYTYGDEWDRRMKIFGPISRSSDMMTWAEKRALRRARARVKRAHDQEAQCRALESSH